MNVFLSNEITFNAFISYEIIILIVTSLLVIVLAFIIYAYTEALCVENK